MTKTIIVADLASRTPNPPLGALLERADTASPPCPCQPPQAAPLALGLRERALVCTQLRRRRIRPLGLQRRHLEPPPSHGHSLARERCTRPSRGRRPRRCHPKSRRMLPVSSSSSVGRGGGAPSPPESPERGRCERMKKLTPIRFPFGLASHVLLQFS